VTLGTTTVLSLLRSRFLARLERREQAPNIGPPSVWDQPENAAPPRVDES